MLLIGHSCNDPVMSDGVKLLRDDDDWNPDSCPRELGFTELALPQFFLAPGIRRGLEEYFSLAVVLSSSGNNLFKTRGFH